MTVSGGVQRVMHALFVAGMGLLAFSSGAGEGSVVIAYGLVPLAMVAALYVIARLESHEIERTLVPFAWTAIALVLALVLATSYSPNLVVSVARLVPNVLGFFLFGYVLSPFYRVPNGHPRYRDVGRVIVICGAVIAAYFVVRFATAVVSDGIAAVVVDRVTGGVYSLPWGATNVVASPLILPFFLTFALSKSATGAFERALYIVSRALLLSAIAVSLSRSAGIAVAAGLAALAVTLRGPQRRALIWFLIFVVLMVVAADRLNNGVLTEQFFSVFAGRFEGSDLASLNGRSEIWSDFASAFSRTPLLGIGYFAAMGELGSTGHNFALTTLVERGIIGLALSSLVLFAAVWYWYDAIRRAREPELRLFLIALGAGGAASVLHLFFEDANFTQQYMILSWVALALPFLARQSVNEPSRTMLAGLPSATTTTVPATGFDYREST